MMKQFKHLFAGCLAVFAIMLCARANAQPRVPENVASDFATRVERYMSARQDSMPALLGGPDRASPQAVLDRRAALSERIKSARKDAKPGEILFPDLVAAVKAIFRSDSFAITGRQVTANARETERPPDNVEVPRVNQQFPKDYGLVSPPATILVQLPELPEALEYRLIGPHLVIRDSDANLIVDVAPNVLSAR
jgi:hypothetical protein